MRSHKDVELVPGLGVPGDRYATKQGHWSDPQWPDQELTLVEEELAAELGVDAAVLRRNIVTRGVNLEDLIGQEFALGTSMVRGVRVCDPCIYLEGLTRPGLFAELAGRGGIRAAVVSRGTVSVGDSVVPVAIATSQLTDPA